MALKEWAEVAQSASVILASLFAIYGIDAWRREFVGKRRMELAEEVLALFYQADDAIASIRSPFGFGGEGETRKPSPNERPEHKDALDSAYVIVERYGQHKELFARIHALRYRFMALNGIDAVAPFNSLNKIVGELMIAARARARMVIQDRRVFQTPQALEEHDRRFQELDLIYWGGGPDDPIEPRVKAIVKEIEKTCRALIESHGTLFGLINMKLGSLRGRLLRW